MRPRPLFLTRRFPPSVGGMETLAATTWETIEAQSDGPVLVAHGGGKIAWILWLPLALLRTARAFVVRRCDVLVTGDALMFMLAAPIALAFRIPTVTLVMGLDLTWPHRAYRFMLRRSIWRAGFVLAISDATADVARSLGVDEARLGVVPLGLDVPEVCASERATARAGMATRLGLPPDALVLLTLGRLVRRKGVAWFIENVLPFLPANVHYVVAGDGPDRESITRVASAPGVIDRVHLLGRVDDDDRELLLRGADVFVQPNIPVSGDMEGFGLVVIEAAMRGTPVVAANLEGIKNACVSGETGYLCEPGDGAAWIRTLERLVEDGSQLRAIGDRFQQRARALYGRDAMAGALMDAMAAARR